jgi:hypothetical protein
MQTEVVNNGSNLLGTAVLKVAALRSGARVTTKVTPRARWVTYSDEKVANRDTKVWHGATENGP